MLSTEEAKTLLLENDVPNSNLEMIIGSFSKRLFIVDQTYLLRTSINSLETEAAKLRRIEALPGVPITLKTGTYSSKDGAISFILATLVPGTDLFSEIDKLTSAQAIEVGYAASDFLNELHMLEGSSYDVGHYVPTVPAHKGTWKEGHVEYWRKLKAQLGRLALDRGARQVIDQADSYFHGNLSSLDYQRGPKLLHDDFHMKNIIVQDGLFSGVIDWECSQYGEADFELVHLVHWALDETNSSEKIASFSKAVLGRQAEFLKISDLEVRLTMYLIEHDLNQIVWAHGATGRYIPRIQGWIEDPAKVNELVSGFH